MFANTRFNITPILDYADAVAREAEIKPIRGTDIKPLGVRRNKHIRITKDPDGAVVCVFYQTEVVTFTPKGDIVIYTGSWHTNSTVNFLNSVLGLGYYNHQYWQGFYLFNRCIWVRDASGHSYPVKKYNMVFYRNGTWPLHPKEEPAYVVHVLNKAGITNVRARYKDFETYLNNMMKLRIDERGRVAYSHEEMKEMFGSIKMGVGKNNEPYYMPALPVSLSVPSHHTRQEDWEKFQMLIDRCGDEDKTQDYYKAMLWVLASSGSGAMASTVKDIFDRAILRIHRDECFKTKQVPITHKARKDLYGHFFR